MLVAKQILKHIFVEFIPNELNNDTIYISREFEIAIHKCACGCGEQVVTPFDTNGWTLTEEDDTITLHPSIGNTFACKSHYFIRRSEVVWA